MSNETLTGVFAGPVIGLKYQTPTCSGMTNEKGEFYYRDGEVVSFSVGNVIVGNTKGEKRVTVANLVSRVDGNFNNLLNPVVTNVARFLQTLDQDGNVDNGITITPEAHEIVGDRPINFNQEFFQAVLGNFDIGKAFAEDPFIHALLEDLNKSGVFTANTPRKLCSPEAARNEVRRNVLGILRFRDVKIPLRNGSYVLADVFRPAKEGKFPVIMNFGIYGKAFLRGAIFDDKSAEEHEQMEDRYFSGNPDAFIFENHESPKTAVWVPQDYAIIRVDGPGTGKSPGRIEIWGIGEAEAFYDAIEWAGTQSWCNGNVGLWGMSYYAMNQCAVASLQPPHLKATVGIGTDITMYEEVLYNGGIPNEEFWRFWWNEGPMKAVVGESKFIDALARAKAHPFNDFHSNEIFGRRAEVFMSPDMSKATVPLWVVIAATHTGHIHQLGSSEAYIHSASKHKKLDLWEDWAEKSYSRDAVADHMAFFDYWLKGIQNGIMDKPPVRLEIRTGNGCSYIQEESEWPIARTQYTKWYLDASPSNWEGDGRRSDFLKLSQMEPREEKQASYSAEVDVGTFFPYKPGNTPPWSTGISFITEPMTDDIVLAGYMKAGLWVSSTSSDMDMYISVRVIDGQNREVDFSGPPDLKDPTNVYPVGMGWLKVSHRKVDPSRSTEYTVKHTHLEADYAPLKGNEVVPVEVEIIPDTAIVKKGQRIRLDIQPHDGAGHGPPHVYDASYHDGAQNTIYTGPRHLSYVQLPIIPAAIQ
jgi:putative CocE/NonD family hydrolase